MLDRRVLVGCALVSSAFGCGRIAFRERDDAGGTGADGAIIVQDDAGGPDAPAGSVTVDFGESTDTNIQAVTEDTMLSSLQMNLNYGIALGLPADDARTPLLRFDLSMIPTTATVFEARLRVSITDDPSANVVAVHRILEMWWEGDQDGNLGVANFVARIPGMGWSSPGAMGASRAVSPSGGFTPTVPNGTYVFVLATAMVQSWVSTPSTNFGIAFDATSDGTGIHSSEAAQSANRPMLRVVYLP